MHDLMKQLHLPSYFFYGREHAFLGSSFGVIYALSVFLFLLCVSKLIEENKGNFFFWGGDFIIFVNLFATILQ
jgi:hypothetical protein